MGRQKGEGARSKARPSSSSLAASLLPSGSAAAAVGFGGYVGSSRLDSSISREDTTLFLDIDGEVVQHLKRLARKDPTTKLKALASLSVLLKQRSGKELIATIPQWAFEYKRLLLDYNREVRRATHDTMANLVLAIGRDLAPHLKSFMGPWWLSQFDSNSEVAQAAKRSLQVAFPAQEKRLEALILCTADIFAYLEENLKLTPQDLSDKAVAMDELEEMHQQVISSSLLALANLLDVLVCTESERPGFENVTAEPKRVSKAREIAVSFAEKLLANHKIFLDFLKSQSPNVRAATYSVLRSFIKNIPQAFNEGKVKILAPAILGAFQERNPACHSSMWEVILLFSRRFPESWTSLNVKEPVLNRFWNFLRNGCFGSQQVSYPALVLFLEIVPPKVVVGEKFFLDFFSNLWAGRNPSQSSNADRLAFFRAFKECLIWGLHNASRYSEGSDSIFHFQVSLVDEILVKLLCKDYLLPVNSKDQDSEFSSMSRDSCLSSRKTVETLNIKYPMSYLQELGRCIIAIVSDIYLFKQDLLSSFYASFEESCLVLFQQNEKTEGPSQNVLCVIDFLFLLEKHLIQKGEAWPLVNFVGPMLAKAFPMTKSADSVDGLKLLSVSASIFGPRKIIQEIFSNNNGRPLNLLSDDKNGEFDSQCFLQVFKEVFVPWCLNGYNYSTDARLDLLLALLDDDCFPDQWSAIISYATNLEHKTTRSGSVDSQLDVLAMLLEKTREEIMKRKGREDSTHRLGSHPDDWHHELLESSAVTVARSSLPFRTSDIRFICAVLGGSNEGDQTSFVSRNSLILILEEVFKKLLYFILASSFNSVKDVGAFFTLQADDLGPELKVRNLADVIQMAQSSVEVIDGSIFCLKTLGKDSELLSSISAAVFIIDWEGSMAKATDDMLDSGSKEKIKARFDICDRIHAFRSKLGNKFWKCISIDVRKRLASILILFIRSAILNEDKLRPDAIASFCCLRILEVLECLCLDHNEEQHLLDLLLSTQDAWPLWIGPSISTKSTVCASNKFVSLIDKLILKLGFGRVIAGYAECIPSSPLKETMNNKVCSRAWLAAEILCTWKWPGGTARTSFLPLMSEYAKSENYSSQESLLNSIFNVLLDGALVHGEKISQSLFDMWPALGDELDNIEEPFLRALVSFLFTLFKENIWATEEAMDVFELLVHKLFIGEDISMNCLRIIPHTMSILIRPLCRRSTESGEYSEDAQQKVQDNIKGWLERTLTFPPLVAWQAGEDMQEWFQLVISCYPLRAMVEVTDPERNISHEERALLLDLFRKQRHGSGAPGTFNQLPLVQMLLSKLMVISVAYCWQEFSYEDWEFIFLHLRSWIQSAVVVMEEVTENINDAIADCSYSDNPDIMHEKFKQILSVSDPSLMNISKNALVSFSLFCGLVGIEGDMMSSRTERWESIKDRIFEGILRIFFCTGIAEAVAGSYSHEAASIVASSRFDHPSFWELVALSVVKSSLITRDRAVKSVEFWGLSKGAICALYAILFSSRPVPSLQFAAYVILSTEPVSQVAILAEGTTCSNCDSSGDQDSSNAAWSSEESVHLREEISSMIEKLPSEVLDMDLTAQKRVNVFLAWSLLLSHLSLLPSLSHQWERLVQYIQDSANSVILDCLFQHIPLELCMVHNLKKKDGELPSHASEVATAATHAIATGSLLFSVESLFPIEPLRMASLAGAMYGLMLRFLPAFVRGWFSDLRNRSDSSLIEAFTRSWCSPLLIENEISQIKKAKFTDENFSVSVSKSANEVVATYRKDDTGMDLVIRLPVSYPLRPVDVDCMRSLGISEVKQRKWLMSMMLFVRNQNGALAEAIRTWKQNFDKEFEGVEECPICYSVIHTANHSLPRLACKTCKHKFHSACLYKWFSTSHKSTCPLCQSPF